MVFNSFNFWIVFPFIFLVYWIIPKKFCKAQNLFLLIVSYLLYMNWKPSFALILLGVTSICYWGGIIINKQEIGKRKLTVCWCFVLLGLLPLLIFKYYNFLNESITSVLTSTGLHFMLPGLNWAIPVGISFYTFQAVGYLMDVYHKRISSEKSFLDFALFVSFFPQVMSGPISTAKDLMPQIKQSRSFKYEQAKMGLQVLLWGMFLKVVIADILGDFVDTVYGHYDYYTSMTCVKASLAYTVQIYCDFAGYSFMAVGIAKILGFNLINNFERPYLAASVTEFWKRWHISLTRWLTTHVYINLGGNRCSKIRQYFNVLITFLVSGLWHGANWTFVLWGVLHGFFQIVEKALMGDRLKKELKEKNIRLTIIRCVRIFITFCLVSFAWIFFRMSTIGEAFDIIIRMFSNADGRVEDPKYSYIVYTAILGLLGSEFIKEYWPSKFSLIRDKSTVLRWMAYMLLFVCIILYGVLDSGSFIYVSF